MQHIILRSDDALFKMEMTVAASVWVKCHLTDRSSFHFAVAISCHEFENLCKLFLLSCT